MLASDRDAKADFVAFFAEGWSIGATDPEGFFSHFGARMTADARMLQPLAPERRGPDGLRLLFTPLFEVLPDLRGELVRWGPTEDGVIAELVLRSPSANLRWTSVDVIELRDGLIAARHAHFDPLPLIVALLKRPLASARLLPSLFRRR